MPTLKLLTVSSAVSLGGFICLPCQLRYELGDLSNDFWDCD